MTRKRWQRFHLKWKHTKLLVAEENFRSKKICFIIVGIYNNNCLLSLFSLVYSRALLLFFHIAAITHSYTKFYISPLLFKLIYTFNEINTDNFAKKTKICYINWKIMANASNVGMFEKKSLDLEEFFWVLENVQKNLEMVGQWNSLLISQFF